MFPYSWKVARALRTGAVRLLVTPGIWAGTRQNTGFSHRPMTPAHRLWHFL